MLHADITMVTSASPEEYIASFPRCAFSETGGFVLTENVFYICLDNFYIYIEYSTYFPAMCLVISWWTA